MDRFPTLARAATVVAAAATALIAVAAPATAAGPTAAQKFYADSGDRCTYGHTEGLLTWQVLTPSIYPTVAVEGTLTDEPARNSPVACTTDQMYSVASYVAYAGRTIVDFAQSRADNGVTAVRDVLGERNAGPAPIDRVVVQVCRFPSAPVGISYCGSPQTYTPPRIGTA
ncbi:hypothetical protein [Phytohabitans houttuyneae]|uniref:Secreted protein n=1 Tax=Phytohabitans houttuyneae TaxID=1076126 RepID=A0A6V8KMF2_9ACTN|nr:hypothetical protein [Phytohabitans houttuyneae]GFJ82897.1 hypothetical protein Phou_070770 [Phytohabitans houttuyneae]